MQVSPSRDRYPTSRIILFSPFGFRTMRRGPMGCDKLPSRYKSWQKSRSFAKLPSNSATKYSEIDPFLYSGLPRRYRRKRFCRLESHVDWAGHSTSVNAYPCYFIVFEDLFIKTCSNLDSEQVVTLGIRLIRALASLEITRPCFHNFIIYHY